MRLIGSLFLICTIAISQPLEERLKTHIGGFEGTVSLYAKNLESGATVGLRQAEAVRTASTIKLPIMLAVFDAVARGKVHWSDLLTVNHTDRVSGSGVIGNEISNGVKLPVADVVHLMMVLSDNTATNMLLEKFNADSVNAFLDSLGLKTTRAMRKIRGDGNQLKDASGFSKAGLLPENQKYGIGVSTPRDMVWILENLDKGAIVSPEASKEMLNIMTRCQDDTGVRRRLGGIKIANKTGALDALRSDVALVYSKRGKIAIVSQWTVCRRSTTHQTMLVVC